MGDWQREALCWLGDTTGRETRICSALGHVPGQLPATFSKLIQAAKETQKKRESWCHTKSNRQSSFGTDCRIPPNNGSVLRTSQVILKAHMSFNGHRRVTSAERSMAFPSASTSTPEPGGPPSSLGKANARLCRMKMVPPSPVSMVSIASV